MGKIRILYFGALSEITGKQEELAEFNGSLKNLIASVIKDNPGLVEKRFSIAVNQEIYNEDKLLSEGDEVALLPPFSGG